LTSVTFDQLGLAEPILAALREENYVTPTPIQARAIPVVMQGRDILGIAQTGTGKTAAFSLPILNHLAANKVPLTPKSMRVLILAPTRELAIQIGDAFKIYGRHLRLRQAVILGGVGQGQQINAMAHGVDVLIATPGRLMDLCQQGYVKLDKVEIMVLDEADRMLDMGFIQPVRKIVSKVPKNRRTLFFSATMPREVEHLAAEILNDPVRIEITPTSTTVERIEQKVFHVEQNLKGALLVEMMKDDSFKRVIVFSRTKHGANRIVQILERAEVPSSAIHGNKSQSARQQALDGFRSGRLRVLVATDIASRGIDVDGITHVINYELPEVPESYVHRIGRTARAGASGKAYSFCAGAERGLLRDIERTTRQQIAVLQTGPLTALPPVKTVREPDHDPRRNNNPQRSSRPPMRQRRRAA
jgi:ATP-dependent RNA helicase RhlE